MVVPKNFFWLAAAYQWGEGLPVRKSGNCQIAETLPTETELVREEMTKR